MDKETAQKSLEEMRKGKTAGDVARGLGMPVSDFNREFAEQAGGLSPGEYMRKRKNKNIIKRGQGRPSLPEPDPEPDEPIDEPEEGDNEEPVEEPSEEEEDRDYCDIILYDQGQITKAHEILQNQRLKLEDLYKKLEVKDVSTFHKEFKKKVGIRPDTYKDGYPKAKKAKRLFDTKSITAEKVKVEAGYNSDVTFTLHFTSMFGTEPGKYKERLDAEKDQKEIDAIADELKNTTKSANKIAEERGYPTRQHMIYFVKKMTKKTPGEFRKSLQDGPDMSPE